MAEIGTISRAMRFAFTRLSISTRRKPGSILLSVVIFAVLAWLATRADGGPGIFGALNAAFVGLGVGFFEQFYVQTLRGRRMRNIHPLLAIEIYTASWRSCLFLPFI